MNRVLALSRKEAKPFMGRPNVLSFTQMIEYNDYDRNAIKRGRKTKHGRPQHRVLAANAAERRRDAYANENLLVQNNTNKTNTNSIIDSITTMANTGPRPDYNKIPRKVYKTKIEYTPVRNMRRSTLLQRVAKDRQSKLDRKRAYVVQKRPTYDYIEPRVLFL